MRELGIKAQYIKPYTVTTIDSDFSSELKNILDEKYNLEKPDAVWCSDITYIWTFEGFVYQIPLRRHVSGCRKDYSRYG